MDFRKEEYHELKKRLDSTQFTLAVYSEQMGNEDETTVMLRDKLRDYFVRFCDMNQEVKNLLEPYYKQMSDEISV